MTTRLCSSSAARQGRERAVRLQKRRDTWGRHKQQQQAKQHRRGWLPARVDAELSCQQLVKLSAPDSTRAISRMTVVLPTPGRPRNSTELGTAGTHRRGCAGLSQEVEQEPLSWP